MSFQRATGGINHAAGLAAIDNKDIHILLGTRLADYVIRIYRRTLPLQLILTIDTDVNICDPIAYLVENPNRKGRLEDSAIDGTTKRQTGTRLPSLKTFSGFNKGSFENKLSKEQMACVNQSEFLRTWYFETLNQDIEDGKQAIIARFYRYLLAHGAHPKNTGANAGLVMGGQQVGTRTMPVKVTPETTDDFMMAMRNVIKQMPRSTPVVNEFGNSDDDMFFFGPSSLESVFMKSDAYNKWIEVGACNACSMFSDTFDKRPRGFMPIGSDCVESYKVESGGTMYTVYPVLFGKRYKGSRAAIHVMTDTYLTENKQSVIFRTDMYWHIHTFDPRFMGIAYIVVEDTQPETLDLT